MVGYHRLLTINSKYSTMDKRLLELAGMDPAMQAHYTKEKKVFQDAHDSLDKLLTFLHSQDNFEKGRGKEDEYKEMKGDIAILIASMKRHLSGY